MSSTYSKLSGFMDCGYERISGVPELPEPRHTYEQIPGASSQEQGGWTDTQIQVAREQGGWTDTQGGLQGVGWLPARRELLAKEGTCGPQTRVGWVSTTPRTSQPWTSAWRRWERQRLGCKMGTFRLLKSFFSGAGLLPLQGSQSLREVTDPAPGLTCLVPFHGSGTPYPCGFGQNSFPCN